MNEKHFWTWTDDADGRVLTMNGTIAPEYIYSGGGGTLLKDDYTSAYFNYLTDHNDGGSNLVGYDNRVQVVANAAPSGMKFAYWKDHANNVVSYSSTYTMLVPGNVTLTAVYTSTSTPVAQTPTVSMQIVRADPGTGGSATLGSISWVSAINIVDESRYTIDDFGIWYGSGSATYEMLTTGNSSCRQAVARKYSRGTYQYSVTINKVSSGKTRTAVAYLTYTDTTTGNTYTVFSSNMLSATMTTA